MSAVLVVAHAERAEALSASADLVDWLEGEGHSVEMGRVEAMAIGRGDLIAAEPLPAVVDLAVSVGGDGTMLRSFDLVAAARVPVLGVNVGHLGYLTEFEPAQHVEVVAAALAGSLGISERMMVSATVRRAPGPDRDDTDEGGAWTGLNEVVLEKRDPGHTVRLEVWLDGDMFATYAADGIIVSTPTGSTRVQPVRGRGRGGADTLVAAGHAGRTAHAVRPLAAAAPRHRDRHPGDERAAGTGGRGRQICHDAADR